VTGAEALYADLGHFGRAAITRCWLAIVLPCLLLAYLGETAAVLRDGSAAASEPFYAVVPGWSTIPVLVVATLATVIASEAVIAGAFTVVHQAGGLGFLPVLRTEHPSDEEAARIYLPAVNWALAVAVLGVVLVFRSSDALSSAYGVAVAATFLCTVTLLGLLAHRKLLPVLFWGMVAVFFAATVPKIASGGWAPTALGALLFLVMTTWWMGQRRLEHARAEEETDVADVVRETAGSWERRTPGAAVFLTQDRRVSPIALQRLLETGWTPAEHVVLLSWHVEDHPGATPAEPTVTLDLHEDLPHGLLAVDVELGYRERLDVRHVLGDACRQEPEALEGVDPDTASYIVSLPIPRAVPRRGPARWWRQLFLLLDRVSLDRVEHLRVPRDRTLVVGAEVRL
jgi:KUP system potassium uptake protein